MSGIIQTITPEEFSLHCPRTEERNTRHLWTIHQLRVHITGPLGPSEESPAAFVSWASAGGVGQTGPGVGLGARWEASLHPSGLEGIQQSGSYKGVSARGRRRGQGQGQGPTGQNPSLAQDAGLPGGVRRWAGGPGKEATTVLAPLPPSACALPSRLRIHRSSLSACLAVSFPYIEFYSGSGKEVHRVPGGKKGPVPRDTSSWGGGGGAEACPSPESPPELGTQLGVERGPSPSPNPARLQLRTRSR